MTTYWTVNATVERLAAGAMTDDEVVACVSDMDRADAVVRFDPGMWYASDSAEMKAYLRILGAVDRDAVYQWREQSFQDAMRAQAEWMARFHEPV